MSSGFPISAMLAVGGRRHAADTTSHMGLWNLRSSVPNVANRRASGAHWRGLASWSIPLFLATSLLHCRNIGTAGPCSAAKTHQGYTGGATAARWCRYKTLTVTPMSRSYASKVAGVSAGAGEPKALHLCRGHFKDYRNSGGLFGKHKGLFWWDMHARGDPGARRGGEGLRNQITRIRRLT